MEIFLVSCSKSKSKYTIEARDMYSSVLFRMITNNIGTRPYYILSAKYGLLEPDKIIEPYDLRLNNLSIKERIIWGENCIKKLISIEEDDILVKILAGNMYRKYITPVLDSYNITYTVPLEGLGIGKQQKYLKENVL